MSINTQAVLVELIDMPKSNAMT